MFVSVQEYNKSSLNIIDSTKSYIVESRIPSLRQGPQGIQGIQGVKGDSFEYQWNNETLKVKHSNETTWSEVNLKGETGDSLMFDIQGTSLGIKTDKQPTYTYFNLKGDKGDKGDSFMFTFDGTNFGVKTDKDADYTVVNLKGDRGYDFQYKVEGTVLSVKSSDTETWTSVDLIGPQGIQGIQGIQGDRGHDLSFEWRGTELGVKTSVSSFVYTNLKGQQGDKGDKGDKGDTGADSTVQGPKGDQGLRGERGESFKIDESGVLTDSKLVEIRAKATQEDYWVFYVSLDSRSSMPTDLTGHLLICFGNNEYIDAGNIKGVKGDKGDTGDQGIQGVKGDKGDTGEQGIQGVKGDTGATGEQGVKGDTGAQGIQGIQGIQGLQGVKGDKGVDADLSAVVAKAGDLMTGDLTINKSNPVLVLKSSTTGAAQTGWISLKNSAGTETAYMGFGSSSTTDLHVVNQIGKVLLQGSTVETSVPFLAKGMITAVSESASNAQMLNLETAGGWSYIQLKSGDQVAHIAKNDGAVEGGAAGSLHLRPDGSSQGSLVLQPNSTMKHQTSSGWMAFGSLNASYAHFETDRPSYHFDKIVKVQGEIYAGSSYNQKVYHQGFKPTADDIGALPITGGTLTGNVVGARLTSTGTGNDYHLGGLEARGNGVTNTVKPTIGFHQPSAYAASIQLHSALDFRLMAQGGVNYADLTSRYLRAPNHGHGLVGLYAATKFQNVFSMGDTYKCDEDGTTLANGYGIYWTHSNNTNAQAKKISGHHAVFSIAGTTKSAIGDHVWTAGDVYVGGATTANGSSATTNAVYAPRYYSSSNIDGTGQAIYCPAGVYSTGTNWLYGSIITSNNPIYAGFGGVYCGALTVRGHEVINDSDTWIRTQDSDGIFFSTHGGGLHMSDATWVRVYNSKRFYVNSTANDSIFTAGGILATQNVTAYSDARIKTDVEVIPDALDKISKIRGVTYTRTDTDSDLRQTGVIAQELREVLPEAVLESDSTLECIDDGKLLTVAYGNVVGLLIEGIKEEKAKRETLEKTVLSLQASFNALTRQGGLNGSTH
jgi:hypothetical protein